MFMTWNAGVTISIFSREFLKKQNICIWSNELIVETIHVQNLIIGCTTSHTYLIYLIIVLMSTYYMIVIMVIYLNLQNTHVHILLIAIHDGARFVILKSTLVNIYPPKYFINYSIWILYLTLSFAWNKG